MNAVSRIRHVRSDTAERLSAGRGHTKFVLDLPANRWGVDETEGGPWPILGPIAHGRRYRALTEGYVRAAEDRSCPVAPCNDTASRDAAFLHCAVGGNGTLDLFTMVADAIEPDVVD